MSELKKRVGKNIRAKRKEKGFTQESFALHVKVDRSYMGRIERGEANISVDILNMIAKAVECEAHELLK